MGRQQEVDGSQTVHQVPKPLFLRVPNEQHGIPQSIYLDRHSTYKSTGKPTIEEDLNGTGPMSEFERAMSELGVKVIHANSPQAKGRIERAWGTFQDRLIAEMRLVGIKNKNEANAFLPSFLKTHNMKFARSPRKRESAFRKRPNIHNLDRILCLKKIRTVERDHTVKFEGLQLQIPPSKKWASIAGQKVTVLQLKDGSIDILSNDVNSPILFSIEPICCPNIRLPASIPPVFSDLSNVLFEWEQDLSGSTMSYRLLVFDDNHNLIWLYNPSSDEELSVEYNGPDISSPQTIIWRVDAKGQTLEMEVEENEFVIFSGSESNERTIFLQ